MEDKSSTKHGGKYVVFIMHPAVSQSSVHFLLLGCYGYIINKSITIWLQLLMHEKDPTLMSKTKQKF